MTIWRRNNGWLYEVFEISTDPSTFGNQADFVATWKSKVRDGRLPAWRDFDPIEDFRNWYGWVNVEDILCAAPYNARFRLFGTNVATIYGSDLTGMEIRDVPGQFFTDVEYLLSEKLVAESLIGRSSGTVRWQDRRFHELCVVELPLADTGVDVDRMLVLNAVVNEGEQG